jgi:hypothetical protein
MERADLLAALEMVEPALADADLVPVLKDFMFTGDRLLAANGM